MSSNVTLVMTTEAPAESTTTLSNPPQTSEDPRRLLPLSDSRLQLISKAKRLYRAVPEFRSSDHLDKLWNGTIQEQIHKDMEPARAKIRKKSRGRDSIETAFMPDLLMTGVATPGATQVLLAPCVWFFCGSKWCKKIIEKIMKDMEWLQSWGIDGCKAELALGGAAIMLAAYGKKPAYREDWGLGLDLELREGFQLPGGFTAYLHVQEPARYVLLPSAMGLLCCSTLTKNDVIVSRKFSRLGGAIWTSEKDNLETGQTCYGMTTAHGLIDAWFEENQEAGVSMHDDVDDDDDDDDRIHSDDDLSSSTDDDEGTFSNDEDLDTERLLQQIQDRSGRKIRERIESINSWKNVSGQMGGRFLKFDFGPLIILESKMQTVAMDTIRAQTTDLLAFRMPPEMDTLVNRFCKLEARFSRLQSIFKPIKFIGKMETNFMEGMIEEELDVVEDSQTSIHAKSLTGTVPLYIRGERLTTVRIRLSIPLGKFKYFSTNKNT